MAECIIRIASASSLIAPMCDPPEPRMRTRARVLPRILVGSPVADALLVSIVAINVYHPALSSRVTTGLGILRRHSRTMNPATRMEVKNSDKLVRALQRGIAEFQPRVVVETGTY